MRKFRHLHLERSLAVLDLETTGLQVRADRIVQLAALKFAPHRRPVLFTRKVNPGIPIPAAATAVHGLTDDDLAGCPPFARLARKLARFLDHCDLAGYGIKRFDLAVLCAEFRRAEVPFPLAGRAVIDAMEIFHLHERRDLAAACAFYCRQQHQQPHRADLDVRVTAQVLDRQLRRYPTLPRTARKLHEQLTPVDLAGRFRLEDGRVTFTFGKHRGVPLEVVARTDRGYLEWMLATDSGFLEDVRQMVGQALEAGGESD